MDIVLQNYSESNDDIAMNTLFSYLDKGIDDIEGGRMHNADSAFQIIRERIESEL